MGMLFINILAIALPLVPIESPTQALNRLPNRQETTTVLDSFQAQIYPEPTKSEKLNTVNRVMGGSMSSFLSAVESFNRDKRFYQWLDTSTDLCSRPAQGTGLSFDFNNACRRHDFGYRNYKKLNVFTKKRKSLVDAIFLKDMRNHCATRSVALKPGCYAAAKRYYAAVRKFGE